MEFEFLFPSKGKEPIVKESLAGTALRNAVSATGKALNAIPSLAVLPENLQQSTQKRGVQSAQATVNNPNVPEHLKGALRRYIPENSQESLISPAKIHNKISEGVSSLFPQGYLEPQGEIEENIQDIGSQILQHVGLGLATGGIATTAQLGNIIGQAGKRAIQGKLGKYGAKSLGAGELGQLAAEIGTPAVLDSLNINNTVKGLRETNQNLYTKAEKTGHQHSIFAKNIKEKTEKLINQRMLKNSDYKDVKDNLIKIYDNIPANDINVGDAFKIKTNLNELIYDSKVSDSAKKVYSNLLPDFNNVLEKASKQYPEFGKYYNDANNLKKILSRAQETSDFIQDTFKAKKLLEKPIAVLFKPEKYIRQSGNALGLMAQLFGDHPKQAWTYYLKAMKAAAEKSTPMFLNNVEKLNSLLEKENNNEYEFIF